MVRFRHRRATPGFTLVELSAVVTIVGVLAVIALVGYRRLITSAHTTEATSMIQAIRLAQDRYKADATTYANVSSAYCAPGSLSGCYPTQTPGAPTVGAAVQKFGWGAPCGGACNNNMEWTYLDVHVDGPVAYGYSTVSGPGGTAPGSIAGLSGNPLTSVSFGTPPVDWYVITAAGDLSNPGNGVYSFAVGSSLNSDILVDNEGE
jgi:type IV pilus assembly protein PilA